MSVNPLVQPSLDAVAEIERSANAVLLRVGMDLRDDVQKVVSASQTLRKGLLSLSAKEHADLGAKRIRHDLRTPINHIIGYTEMIRDEGPSDAETFGNLARILHRSRMVLDALDDVVERVLTEGSLTATPMPAPIRSARGSRTMATSIAPDSGFSVLVAEDNEQNAELLQRWIGKLGHRVTLTRDGAQALAALRAHRFDLVMLDIVMPNVDGISVLRAVKADPQLAHLPVLMISSLDEVDSVAQCIELGAADYLTKPFEPVLLRARISACLESKRLRDEQQQHLERIEVERRRANELLRVILPDQVVEELERTRAVKPRRFENVAVLFCDIVGFTRYCDTREPEEVLRNLQSLVSAFEDVAQRHRLQKIKTIGDGFMAVGGLLVPLDAPVKSCLECAEAMHAATDALGIGWRVRIGVHVGPVVAGVLGRRQFQYDLWGDTVNTASRVEAYGRNGATTLSKAAWEAVERYRPQGIALGKVELKGKGEFELYEFHGFAG